VSAEGGGSQDTERRRGRRGTHGLSRGSNTSGHQDKGRKERALTDCQTQREEQVRTPNKGERVAAHGLFKHRGRNKSGLQKKKKIGRGTLTDCRAQREGQVRTPRESEKARGAHRLSSAEAEACQNTKGRRESERHSQTGAHNGRDKSGQQENG
jgi:hypothetical protein